jgi:hypothetical protein
VKAGNNQFRDGWCRVSKPFTTTVAIATRMRELDITAAELADRAGVSRGTVRSFGLLSHDWDTLERLSVTLGWPPDHLRELWDGEAGTTGRPE